jgi:CPA2 family monovalent cation:H+ antiporter-2
MPPSRPGGVVHELRLLFIAVQFLTRVPIPRWVGFEPDWLNQCARHFPLVGLGVGALGVAVLWAAALVLPWPVAVETGLLLGPGGEFALIVLAAATALGLMAQELSSFMIAVTSITMATIPVLSVIGRRLAARLRDREGSAAREFDAPPEDARGHAIVIGYGRVGKVVCALLAKHRLPYVAVDSDASAIPTWKTGHEVYYGNATEPDFLLRCGLMEAKAVIVTHSQQAGIDEMVRWVRGRRADIVIVARARDAAHARHLYTVGVTDAVPETIEASLQLSEAALLGLGLPTGPVIASIHETRDAFRRELQQPGTGQAG